MSGESTNYSQTAEFVRQLLTAAGIAPDTDEIERAIKGYPALRESMERLYRIPYDHEEDLAVIFSA